MLLTSVSDWMSTCRSRSLKFVLRKLVIRPGAAQPSANSTPKPASGSESNTGTTITVGSLGISLYTVDEITSTVTPVSVRQMSPRRGGGFNDQPACRGCDRPKPR